MQVNGKIIVGKKMHQGKVGEAARILFKGIVGVSKRFESRRGEETARHSSSQQGL